MKDFFLYSKLQAQLLRRLRMNRQYDPLIELIARAKESPQDRALFRQVVEMTLALKVVDSVDEFARRAGVRVSTVERWRDGTNSRHGVGRLSLYWCIEDWLNNKLPDK